MPTQTRSTLRFLALSAILSCGSDESELDAAAESVSRQPASSTASYELAYHLKITAEKFDEPHTDMVMRAVVHELPERDADGNNFVGKGHYEGRIITRKVNCDNNLPMDREVISFSDSTTATASMDDIGGGQISMIFTITPSNSPKMHMLTKSFRDVEAAAAEDEMPDLILPTLGSVMLKAGEGEQTRTSQMYGGSCAGMLTYDMKWTAKGAEPPCEAGDAGAEPGGEAKPEPMPELVAEQTALVEGLRAAGFGVGPQHVSVTKGEITKFGVRLAEGGCVLRSIESIESTCVAPGSQKGARRLLLGGVQRTADATRVTARIVEAETGVVVQAAKADAAGIGPEAATAAMAEALRQLGLEAACVE